MSSHAVTDETLAPRAERVVGVLAEYDSPGALLEACRRVRDAGFSRWDSYTPFPVHGVEKAMGIKRTALPWLVLGGGLTGGLGGLVMQWWMNAVDYPFLISGKPLWSLPANIPIIFELTILLSALTAFFSMLAINGLPQLYHPIDRVRRFRRVTTDGFFIMVEADDPKFDEDEARRLLESTGPRAVETVRG